MTDSVFCRGSKIRSMLLLGIMITGLVGCSGSTKSTGEGSGEEEKPAGPLKLLVVDDEKLASAIKRQWQASSEGELVVETVDSSSLLDGSAKTPRADVIVYPPVLMGDLIRRRFLSPIPQEILKDKQWNRDDLFPLEYEPLTQWGSQIYALSFGSTQLCLMYRADIFAQHDLRPPSTWQEYQQTVELLAEQLGSDADAPVAAIEPLAAGWAHRLLLARAASYARQNSRYWTLFNYRTMEPMIASPPFVRALEELVAARKSAKLQQVYSPAEARSALLSGKTVMAITWPVGQVAADLPDAKYDIRVARLPGATTVYSPSEQSWEPRPAESVVRVPLVGGDGRVGSALRLSSQPKAAYKLLQWLTGTEHAAAVSARSEVTAPFRRSQSRRVAQWVDPRFGADAATGYWSALQDDKSNSIWLPYPRLPGQTKYAAALDLAVAKVLAGEAAAVEALSEAADTWNTVTDRLDRDAQRDAYQNTLGVGE